MDELDIKGKRYISSKRASQMTGYAKDYIGQLAREGKILGTRVGRAWYLDEDSLLAHAKTDFTGAAFPESVQMPQTVQHLPTLQPNFLAQPPELPKTWSSIRYLEDDSSLLPQLRSDSSTPAPENVPIEEPIVTVLSPENEIKVPMTPAPVRVHVRTNNVTNIDGLIAHQNTSLEAKIAPQKAQKLQTREVTRHTSSAPVLILVLIAIVLLTSAGLATVATYKNTLGDGGVLQTSSVIVSTEYFADILR